MEQNRFRVGQIEESDVSHKDERAGLFRMPERFSRLNRLIMRDLNGRYDEPHYFHYKKEDIVRYLKDPYRFEKQLREACINVYSVSTHFRRLIQYFGMLTDYAYVITPHRIDTTTVKKETLRKRFIKVMNVMESFKVKSQFSKIITVCLREDVFYGTLWVTQEDITIQQLPSDYCKISVIEGGVYNVTFNFAYFDANPDKLPFYPEEFRVKHEEYKQNRLKQWVELDSPTSFAIKCSSDIGNYPVPPFAGLLAEIYEIDEYKTMKLTKTELENYAILVMKLGLNSDGTWQMDLPKASEFWRNLDDVLPDAVGSVLTPMPIEKISFDRTSTPEADGVSDAVQNLFSSAGVSSLLFNSSKASSNALLLSIKADQGMTFGIIKSCEGMVNRYIQSLSYGKNFKVEFIDSSPFNRDEVGSQYLKMCQYGFPMLSYLGAVYGLPQSNITNLNYLEDEVLELKQKFRPLQSSATMSSKDIADANNDTGRPAKNIGELGDAGEETQERDGE